MLDEQNGDAIFGIPVFDSRVTIFGTIKLCGLFSGASVG